MTAKQRVWMVENEASDDEQNILITTYATPDGSRYVRFERAVVLVGGFEGVPVSLVVGCHVQPQELVPVDDPLQANEYRQAVRRRRQEHDPEDRL